MIPVVRVKDGVQFTVIAPAGFRILAAIDAACKKIGHDVTITSACDGTHSGVDDPHHKGRAYDIRTHDVPDKQALLDAIVAELGTEHFFAFIEDPNTDNEHIHAQQRKNTVYPPLMVTNYEEVQQATAGE
jgi:hypothetical protein